MRGLELNLATRPFRNNTLIWAGYIVLFAAAAGFSYWNVSAHRSYTADLAELDARDGNIEQEQQDLSNRHRQVLNGVGDFDIKSIGRRTTKANEVIQWRAFSWTRLFNRLEDVLPHDVRMTSVRPIFRERDRNEDSKDSKQSVSVNVEGLARDWDAFFEIQTRLIEHRSFGHVNPRFIEKVANGGFAFSIEFGYYPDDEEEGTAEPAIEAAAGPAPDSEADQDPPTETANTTPQRALPPADTPATEVTDEWAGSSDGPKTEADEPAKTTQKQSQRRALPRVQPEQDDSDKQEGGR